MGAMGDCLLNNNSVYSQAYCQFIFLSMSLCAMMVYPFSNTKWELLIANENILWKAELQSAIIQRPRKCLLYLDITFLK